MDETSPTGGPGAAPSTRRDLAVEWKRRALINTTSHNKAERRYSSTNMVLVLSSFCALVALGVVAASFDLTQGYLRIVALGLGLLAAVTSATQALLDYGAKSAAHRIAARQYASINRALELVLAEDDPGEDWPTRIAEIRRQWDWAASAAPNVPDRIREEAKRQWP